jgi:chorismate synthase
MAEGDSLGGVVECAVTGLSPGIGEPVVDKLDAALARASFSIGGVKAMEFGDGLAAARVKGSEHNDGLYCADGKVQKSSNHSGGVAGGISDGGELLFRTAFKPTPSISKPQRTVNAANENIELSVKGRHDPLIAPRAVVVVEAMTALTLADLCLMGAVAKMENLERIYNG